MFSINYTNIEDYIISISSVNTNEEKQVLAVKGIIEIFNFDSISLYSYSCLSKLIERIFQISKLGKYCINENVEDARKMPPIYSSLLEGKTKYIGKDMISQITRKNSEVLNPFLVVPIYTQSNVIGYFAVHDVDEDIVKENLLNELTYYGNRISELFIEFTPSDFGNLNKRELEILQRLSLGESNVIIADYLGLSPYTVQDYIKSIMLKFDVQTRVEAVAVAFRSGILK